MAIDDKIWDEKRHYDINRETANISALSSGKIDKYEYLTGEEILRSNQRQITEEQPKLPYSPIGKVFGATKFLAFLIKKDKLKQIKVIFPQNLIMIWFVLS